MRAFLATGRARAGSRVGATYTVPVAALGEAERDDEQTHLTLQARSSFGQPPPPFCAWSVSEDGSLLHVPRFYGLARFGPAEADDRVDGDPVALRFEGTLTEVQERASAAIFGKYLHDGGEGGALVSLPCGYGKTVWGVYAIARMGRKACVLVHKAVIRDQWKETFERFCPGIRVGYVQGKVWQVGPEYDVVIAMVMTLAKRQYDPHVMDAFGVVVADEAHHMAAPVMNLAMRSFRARRIVGLTATKERPDGLTPLLHWCLGPEAFRVERECESVKVSMALFAGGCREVLSRDGRPLVSIMINQLAKCAARNAFLADRIAALRRTGRVLLVLSDRLAQLEILRTLVVARGVPVDEVGVFVGATREAERATQLAKPVVFCSYAMANEGVDKREADTCVMATPKGRVTQCIGRVQRPCPTKKEPLVLDVVDDLSVFVPLRWKRQRQYSKEGYEVQVVSVEGARDEDWFV